MQLSSFQPEHVILVIFVGINVFAFLVMGYDKYRSRGGNGARRTPEGYIFFLAAVLGAIGIYLGMLIFRHKTRKWYFQVAVPLFILQNLAIFYVLKELWSN